MLDSRFWRGARDANCWAIPGFIPLIWCAKQRVQFSTSANHVLVLVACPWQNVPPSQVLGGFLDGLERVIQEVPYVKLPKRLLAAKNSLKLSTASQPRHLLQAPPLIAFPPVRAPTIPFHAHYQEHSGRNILCDRKCVHVEHSASATYQWAIHFLRALSPLAEMHRSGPRH